MVKYEVISQYQSQPVIVELDWNLSFKEISSKYPWDIYEQIYEGMKGVVSRSFNQPPNSLIKESFKRFDNWKYIGEVDNWSDGMKPHYIS